MDAMTIAENTTWIARVSRWILSDEHLQIFPQDTLKSVLFHLFPFISVDRMMFYLCKL